jgi:uncharacterized protein YukE
MERLVPWQDNWDQSKAELVNMIEVINERLKSSGDGARRLHLENERVNGELQRTVKLYHTALHERNQVQEKLEETQRDLSEAIQGKATLSILG